MTFYGLYKITNMTNGKMYIGQHTTTNLDDGYMGSGKVIQFALKKYGKENFRKEWLMFCEDQDELNYMERVFVDQTWVDRSDTYNLRIGGDNPKLTDEIKEKISKTLLGRKNPEHSKSMSGRKWFNNGEKSVMALECPKGFVEGRVGWVTGTDHEYKPNVKGMKRGKSGWRMPDEQRRKISMTLKEKCDKKEFVPSGATQNGMKWWNNGSVNIRAIECPSGFVAGQFKTLNRATKISRGEKS